MYLVLLRHSESVKNIKTSFASNENNEPLTSFGINQSELIAQHFYNIIKKTNLVPKYIYCTNSVRSIGMADIIAKKLNITTVAYDSLVSTKAGALAGIAESEAAKSHEDFINELYLYRKGLFNAYDFTVAKDKESKPLFEKRVLNTLHEILKSEQSENIKIIVTHRSPITTILIDFAKKIYKYPTNFLGYIELDLGHVSWLKLIDNKWKFFGINESILDFEEKILKYEMNNEA